VEAFLVAKEPGVEVVIYYLMMITSQFGEQMSVILEEWKKTCWWIRKQGSFVLEMVIICVLDFNVTHASSQTCMVDNHLQVEAMFEL
jgi:hypothetical protein